jgi:hypothetical protein
MGPLISELFADGAGAIGASFYFAALRYGAGVRAASGP